MGFNIVVLGDQASSLVRRFSAQIEDLGWTPVGIDSSSDIESEASDDFARFRGIHRPRAMLSLAEGSKDDAKLLSQLKYFLPYCEKESLPLIHLSNYRALHDADPLSEHLDSVLAPSSTTDTQIYAELEQLVGSLPKHIILRRSWVLNTDADSLFTSFIPAILNGSSFTVSSEAHGCPISRAFIVNAIIAIVQQVLTGAENWGLYHLQSADKCSEAEFCDHLIRHLTKELGQEFVMPQVAAHESSERFLEGAANLSGRKLTDDFGIQLVSWRKGFSRTLQLWLEKHGRGENQKV